MSRKWLGLIAASLGMFLGALDLTVNVGLPAIRAAFDTDIATVQWIIIAYVGTSTGLQLVMGRWADARGHKRVYLGGVACYTLAVLLIGLADSFTSVLALRVLQAVGYSMIVATAPALVTRLFDDGERGRALGAMTGVGTAGLITATLAGGLLIETWGWASVFLARVPLAAAAFAFAYHILPDDRQTGARPGALSAFLLFAALTSLVLFVNLGGRMGWSDPRTITLLAAAVLCGATFLRVDRRAQRPIVALDIFTPAVIRALLAGFCMSMATFVNLFILPFYVSDILGAGALVLGLLLAVPPAFSALMAPIGGRLSDHLAPAVVAMSALVVIAVAMFSFSTLGTDATSLQVGVCLGLFGIGMGTFQASNTTSVMTAVDGARLGSAGALLSLALSLGMMSSVGIMTAVFEGFRDAAPVGASADAAFIAAFAATYQVAGGIVVVGLIILLSGVRFRR